MSSSVLSTTAPSDALPQLQNDGGLLPASTRHVDSDGSLFGQVTLTESKQEFDASKKSVRDVEAPTRQKRGANFWATIFVVNIVYFIALLETSSISTALPTIIDDLHGSDFVWAGAAYNIAATAFMPLTGGIAQAFGRRWVMLASLFLFSLGSAMCGAANTDKLLVAGRAVQGAGGAGLFSMSYIVLSDIVPLHERGKFNGITQFTWCIAGGVGPAVGGALAQSGNWRWLFYLNLPITGGTAVFVVLFMRLKTPEGDFMDKIKRIDIIGNLIIMSSTVSVAIALTWGGAIFPWSSPRVLVPLVLGAVGMVVFLVYEATWAQFPLVPFHLLKNRTSVSGYLQNAILFIPFTSVVFYLPIYFQACKGFGPLHSGISLFALAFSLAPVSVLAGLTIHWSARYRPQLWAGWALAVPALALLGTVDVATPLARVVGFQILVGAGIGLVIAGAYFPVLAAAPVESSAPALALLSFLRQFGQIWAITVSGAVLQNELARTLPADFAATLLSNSSNGGSGAGVGGGGDLAFAVIPLLAHTPEPLRGEVAQAFAAGLRVVWQVLAGFAGAGLLASLAMRGLELHQGTDKKWGLEKEKGEGIAVGVAELEGQTIRDAEDGEPAVRVGLGVVSNLSAEDIITH